MKISPNPTFPLRGYPENTEIDWWDETGRLVQFCAEEVRRQQDTPWHVWKLYRAFGWAQERYMKDITIYSATIREIGKLVDEDADMGYRNDSIWIGGIAKMHHAAVPGAIDDLVNEQGKLTPLEFYARFEEIHPFFDGNGRSGKVLYNWKNGTLWNPVWPKDLYGGIENP